MYLRYERFKERILSRIICVNECKAIFKELVFMAASVCECLRSRIFDNSHKLYKIIVVMKHYKKILFYIKKHFFRKVIALKIYQ